MLSIEWFSEWSCSDGIQKSGWIAVSVDPEVGVGFDLYIGGGSSIHSLLLPVCVFDILQYIVN